MLCPRDFGFENAKLAAKLATGGTTQTHNTHRAEDECKLLVGIVGGC